jgi:hypothetical protein
MPEYAEGFNSRDKSNFFFFLKAQTIKFTFLYKLQVQMFCCNTFSQRWASTLLNRSNARHRSNIRAPPRPPPHRCMYLKCGNLCGQRGRKRFIASWGLRMSHICHCTPCPSPQGYRSKVESRHFAHHCF